MWRLPLRGIPLLALLAAMALLGLSIAVAARERTSQQVAGDHALTNRAADEAAAINSYFERARAINLLTANNPGFVDFYRLGARDGRGPAHRQALEESKGALNYLEHIYPTSIGEACFIDRAGPENARIVRGQPATDKQLSPDERANSFFAPTFALSPGQVYQARPYVSPDTHEWVISNSTPLPMPDGSKPAIVHFEITAESFRASAAAIAGADTVRIVDRRTGAVIVDSRHRQRLHAPLGAPDDHRFRGLRDQGADTGVTTIGDRRVAFRTVARSPHNANDWLVTVSSPHPMASWLGSLGPGPIGMAAAALLLLAVAGLTFRSSQRELRVAATTDSLTGLPNRRSLFQDLDEAASRGSAAQPRLLALFDLDGFKAYNDAFGHPAGDALLARLATRLRAAVAPWGHAYRLGGDEFCVLASVVPDQALAVVEEAGKALSEQGEGFHIRASHGAALLPIEVDDGAKALHLADERMYAAKAGGRPTADDQSAAVLLRALHERFPDLEGHSRDVADLAEPVAVALDLDAPQRQRLRQVAHLHDIGKVAIPESILDKPGPLDDEERAFIRRHTLIGERILNAAPALAPAAAPVRSSHERWEGDGYPDGLVGEEIPLVSRIVSVCDAFQAMTSIRPYSQPRTPAAALSELRRCAGTQFDPRVVKAFCDVQARATAAEPAAT